MCISDNINEQRELENLRIRKEELIEIVDEVTESIKIRLAESEMKIPYELSNLQDETFRNFIRQNFEYDEVLQIRLGMYEFESAQLKHMS